MPTDYAIKNGRTVFDATTYTGNGAARSITNAGGFKPDFVWVKDRTSGTPYHQLTDSVRGSTKQLFSNGTDAEDTNSTKVTAFDTTGFSLGNSGAVNASGDNYVAWQWQAGQGTNTTNTSGSITSTVSVNPAAGFSIVTYTGTGANATVGHGLGVAPKFIIIKNRSVVASWDCYHASLGATKYIRLNSTNAAGTSSTSFNNTEPTSTVFSLGTDNNGNGSGNNHVAYCWSEVAGFSKFGSYTGNGNADGPFVYTGFRPKFIMVKNSNTTNGWGMFDSSRNTSNVTNLILAPNASDAEATYSQWQVDFLSNGFKIRSSTAEMNGSGNSVIYACFAENPFKYSNAR